MIKLADKDHIVFKAHFPNNPILPAFLQIEIFSEILNEKIFKIKNAKFISFAMPNDVLTYEIIKKTSSTKVIIKKDNKKIGEFSYE